MRNTSVLAIINDYVLTLLQGQKKIIVSHTLAYKIRIVGNFLCEDWFKFDNSFTNIAYVRLIPPIELTTPVMVSTSEGKHCKIKSR